MCCVVLAIVLENVTARILNVDLVKELEIVVIKVLLKLEQVVKSFARIKVSLFRLLIIYNDTVLRLNHSNDSNDFSRSRRKK